MQGKPGCPASFCGPLAGVPAEFSVCARVCVCGLACSGGFPAFRLPGNQCVVSTTTGLHRMGEKGGVFLPRESKKRLEYMLANLLELPKDLVMDLPRVTLLGDMQVIVENHRGIIEYTRERVRISTSLGELIIDGTSLALRTIFPEEIAVDGKIRALSLGG